MKNKIHKYDFLIVGAGLIGTIAALALIKKKFKVLVIDKNNRTFEDNRTLAVNANSVDFLKSLGIWNDLRSKPQPIDKIVIKDYINKNPLIFENVNEPMGNVIFNKEIYKRAVLKLKKFKILITNSDLKTSEFLPHKKIYINQNYYTFKKVIMSIGKNIILNKRHSSIIFNSGHYSQVGFIQHTKNHNNTAYEFFTDEGPLAILPVPADNRKRSTFIYSSKDLIDKSQLKKLIYKKIEKSHGKLIFDQSILKFPITPHLTKDDKNYIYVGDSLKSIHPVAGQGWNLGIKDVQTLCRLIDQFSLEEKNFNSYYYSRRFLESTLYLGFTSILNHLYENKNSSNIKIVKLGFKVLNNIKVVRDLFIRQAMGRTNLID